MGLPKATNSMNPNGLKRIHDVDPLLPDLLAEDLDVLFCGINPALSAARAGHHFSNKNNRFWRVLHAAGFTSHLISPTEDYTILKHGCGLTAAVERPTIRAKEVMKEEFRASADRLEQKVRRYNPRFLAFLGKSAFAAISNEKLINWGEQSVLFGGARVWILPNPSGLNCAFTFADLTAAYRELRTVSQKNQ